MSEENIELGKKVAKILIGVGAIVVGYWTYKYVTADSDSSDSGDISDALEAARDAYEEAQNS